MTRHQKCGIYKRCFLTVSPIFSGSELKFVAEQNGRSVDQLWSDFVDKLDQLTDQCIPTKVIKGKPSLPWISREIKRLIHKRNKFYKSYRKTDNSQLRKKSIFLSDMQLERKPRLAMRHTLKDRQNNQATSQGNSKKLFQYLKNSRTDQQGIPP